MGIAMQTLIKNTVLILLDDIYLRSKPRWLLKVMVETEEQTYKSRFDIRAATAILSTYRPPYKQSDPIEAG
jgi:hypothetical protein